MKWFLYVFIHHYADFRGRAGRREYWSYVAWLFIISMVFYFVVLALDPGNFHLWNIILYVTVCPSWAVMIRRLHDTGRCGWWSLLMFIPLVGQIIALMYMLEKSQSGENAWGAEPVSTLK